MKNKIVYALKMAFVAVVLWGVQGCKERDLVKRYQNAVKNASRVAFYEIDEFPTEKTEQQKAKEYINDYEIKRTISLDETVADSVKKELSNWSNYDTTNVKSCPFVAKYALLFQQKTTTALVVLGVAPCGRAVWSGSDATWETKTVELAATNQIENLLHKIATK
ncbi:MAG: hypothetical protein RL757_2050 [Bacteroidota bacterium]|jgi:hypothetical protein